MPLQVLSIPAKLPLQPAEGKQFLVRQYLKRYSEVSRWGAGRWQWFGRGDRAFGREIESKGVRKGFRGWRAGTRLLLHGFYGIINKK